MYNANLRNRYVSDAIATASPAKLLTMLYDRLVRDLVNAEAAIVAGALLTASEQLTHAQDIILELRASLKVELWDGAPALADLYAFLLSELIAANVSKDAARVATCRGLVEPLQQAWHAAADELARQSGERMPVTAGA